MRCQAMTVSGLRMSSADRQSFHGWESQIQRTRSAQAGEACGHAANAAGPEADGAEQESLLAERSEAGSSLTDNKVESALVWKGYTPLLCKCNDFNAYGVFGRDCVKKARKRHAVRKMKVGPSEPPCRRRPQTAISCFGPKGRGGERYG